MPIWPFNRKSKREKALEALSTFRAVEDALEIAAPAPSPDKEDAPVFSLEEQVVQNLLKLGYNDEHKFRPAEKPLVETHSDIAAGVLADLRIRRLALIKEIKDRNEDLIQLDCTIYGYEQAQYGFGELERQRSAARERLEAAEQQAAEAAEALEEPTAGEQVDDPNLPATGADVIPDQEAAQAQVIPPVEVAEDKKPVSLDTIRKANKKTASS